MIRIIKDGVKPKKYKTIYTFTCLRIMIDEYIDSKHSEEKPEERISWEF